MFKRMLLVLLGLGPCGLSAAEAPAAGAESERAAFAAAAAQFEGSLAFQQGEVKLPNGIATLQIPAGFRYLDPPQAQRVLEDAWGNPDGKGTLGMIFPSDGPVIGDGGWGVVITYEEDGHVSDADADKIDYNELLTDMQKSLGEQNKERRDLGYAAIELVGWAARPHYDKAERKLYWAKELKFGDAAHNTLNYNIRILGRKGVLVLNAVSGMQELSKVEQDMRQVLAFANFTPGNRYQDFDGGVDKVAAYGLGALVAGGIAAKTGLLAKLLVLLLAFKKAIVLGAVAVAGVVGKLLFGRKDQAN